MVASSGEESASDAHHGPATTMRRRRCLRRRMHAQAMRRSTSTEKNPTEAPSNWPFWWLGAAAIAVFVTPGLSSAILNPTHSMHELAMDRLWASFGHEQRWWMENERADKMIFTPNYDDEHFFDAFKKPRPQGVRYRDDETLHRIAMQQLHVYPVMVQERPRPEMMDQGESSGSGNNRMMNDPTLEDIDLIDVLWREDIEREKSGGASVAPGVGVHPSDQVERDLQLLTEKSVQAPLTLEESSRYEDLSKSYFEDFYSNRRFVGEFASGKSIRRGVVGGSTFTSSSTSSSSPSCSSSAPSSSSSAASGVASRARASSSSSTVTQSGTASSWSDEDVKPRTPEPSDADVDALFEDLGKECGELNMLMPTEGAGMNCPLPPHGTIAAPSSVAAPPPPPSAPLLPSHAVPIGYTGPIPTADTLLQNVSLASIAPYNPANLTELDFMVRDDGSLTTAAAASQQMLPSIVGSLSAVNGTNGFPEPTQFWFESTPDGTASYQSRQPVLNMSTLQLPPLVGMQVGGGGVDDLQQQVAAAAAADDMNMPPAHHELTTLTGRMPVYETRPTNGRTASMSSTNETQSLGAASSSSSSSSSPHYSSTSTQGGAGSDGENRSPRSRFYGKLAPALAPRSSAASISLFDDDEDLDGDATGFFRSPSLGGASLHSHSGLGLNSAVAPRRRGRQSKDEQLASSNGLPVSAAEIADMSLPDLQKLLKAESLTEPQRQLIRKIRRRGKNKVAARTCRQRRGVVRTDHVGGYESSRVLGYSNRH